MTDWALTRGLQNLRSQVNETFPDRDKASDGTIGDLAHQGETSGHNPDDTSGSRPEWDGDSDATPEVRAWDMDSDLRFPGVTAQDVVDHIRRLPGVSLVLRYMIYNRKIYRASNGWQAEAYTGPSAHTEHVHFSGAYSQTADNDDTTFDYHLEDLTMTPDQIAAAVWAYQLEDPLSTTTPKGTKPAGAYQRYNDAITNDAANRVTVAVTKALNGLVATLAPAITDVLLEKLPDMLPDGGEVTAAKLQDAMIGVLQTLVARQSA